MDQLEHPLVIVDGDHVVTELDELVRDPAGARAEIQDGRFFGDLAVDELGLPRGLEDPAKVERRAGVAHLSGRPDHRDQILRGDSRRLHSLLRDQRALAGIGRAWANEILHHARLSPFALSTQLSPEEVERLAEAIDAELARGLELRERGASDKKVYRVHNRLHEPCPRCGDPLEWVDYGEHSIYYCPACQTEGRLLKDRRLSRLLR